MISRPLRSVFRSAAGIAVVLGIAAAAAPAFAVTTPFGFDFTVQNGGSEGYTNIGQSITFNSNGLKATVTAWNLTPVVSNGTTTFKLTQARIGYYNGGLGVLSDANDNPVVNGQSQGVDTYNTHQVDNMGNTKGSISYDFLQVSFSAAVTFGSVGLNAYGLYNSSGQMAYLDDDFSYGKNATALTASNNNTSLAPSALGNMFQTNVSSSQVDSYTGGGNTVSGANGCQDGNGDGICQNTFTLSQQSAATANTASQNWYVAASIASNYGGDGIADGLKLASATVYYVPTGAVPEPKSWAMMLMGFGAIGIAMRRRSAPLTLLLNN